MRTSRLISSIFLALALSLFTVEISSAVTFPPSPPSGSATGGTFGLYFQRMVSPCPSGQVVTGFATGSSTYGTIICAVPPAGSETDPEVGSNTANYLSKWNGSALVTSQIYDNGTSIGIGTSTGTYKFEVAGSDIIVNGIRIGKGSGSVITNTVLGTGTLSANTSGNSNTAIGYRSLSSNTNGAGNTAVGHTALTSNIGGSQNTALGYLAMTANTTGNQNVAIGYQSLNANTGGVNNTVVGAVTLTSSKGDSNIAFGNFIGSNLTTGSNNILIGNSIYAASASASNTLNIGNLIYGTSLDGFFSTPSSGNIGIGVISPTYKLEVAGTGSFYGLRVSSGASAGKVLTSDATGNASWQTPGLTGGQTNYLARWLSATTLGTGSITDDGTNVTTTGDAYINGIRIGRGSGSLLYNLSVGQDVLKNNTTGNQNVGVGNGALMTNTTGYADTANGYLSLSNNTTGYSNTANGFATLYNNTVGYNNTTAGFRGLYNNISGNGNTANGFSALDFNVTGSNNTALGYTAGYNLTSGDNNIFIGYNTQPNISNTSSNQLNIGNWIYGNAGNIGIGVLNPTEKFAVAGTGSFYGIKIGSGASAGKVLTSDASGNGTWQSVAYTETDPEIGANTTNYVSKWNGSALVTSAVYESGGNVGIGTISPGNKLEITQGTVGNSGLRFTNLPAAQLVVSTTLATTGTWPEGTAVDSQGNAYVANFSTNNVTKITPAGVSSTFATAGTGPRDIAIDSADNLYVANGNSNNVTKITPAGVSSVLGTTGAQPTRIILDSSGNIYTLNYSAASITKITPAGVSTTFATGATDWYDFTIDKSGNIYTVAYSGNQVQKITPSGVVTTLATGVSYYPSAIAADNDGNVYVNDSTWPTASPRLVKVTPNGVVSTFATGISQAPALYSTYLTADDSGNIYSANYRSASKISPTGVVTQLGSTGDENTDIVVGKDGNLYTTNATSNNITKFTLPQTKYLTTNGSGDVIAVSTPIAPGIAGQTLINNGTSWVPSSQIFNNGGNIGIGKTTPAAILDVNGDALVNGVTIGLGGGNVSSNTANGYRSLYSNAGGTSNVAYGWSTLENNTGGTQNTALGYTALRNNRTGNGNIAVGMQSLLANTVGTYNVAMGHQALYSNTGGGYGVAIGYQALYLNTTGWANDAIGSQAMMSNRTGNNNVALGGVSLGSNDSGNANVALGQYSLAYNSIGSYNTAVGNQALYWSKGNFNTALGYQTLYDLGSNSPPDAPGHYNIAIGTYAGGGLTAGSGNIFIGRETAPSVGYGTANNELNIGNVIFGTNIGTVGTGAVGIGTSNPGAKLEVAGQIKITGGSPGLNKVLTSDAVGLASWSTAPAPCTPAGVGTFNTCLGTSTLQSNTVGSYNTSVGYAALSSNTGGNYNNALGYAALTANLIGNYNNAFGDYALNNNKGDSNSAFGQWALSSNTTGANNTAMGASALYNSTGSNNTAVGAGALTTNTGGSNNTAIGYNANVSNGNLSNVTLIGANTVGSQSNTVILGSSADVGIGTSTPGSKLDLRGQFRLGYSGGTVSDRLTLPSATTNLWNIDNNAGTLRIFRENWSATGAGAGGLVKLTIANGGDVTITNNVYAAAYYYSSDRSWKKDIIPLSNPLDKLLALQGVSFRWKDTGRSDIGFIAQDVEKVIPEIVSTNSEGKKSVEYANITALTVEAIKEQQKIIDAQKVEIDNLKLRLEKLEKFLSTK